ncbi:MAG TPA: hypothetical protein VHB98_07395 [Chloroflexota bacterium]|nr:hypothetical protein [Chloroflexota bacterium]
MQVRGQWVEQRPERIEQALAFFDRQGVCLADDMGLGKTIQMGACRRGCRARQHL